MPKNEAVRGYLRGMGTAEAAVLELMKALGAACWRGRRDLLVATRETLLATAENDSTEAEATPSTLTSVPSAADRQRQTPPAVRGLTAAAAMTCLESMLAPRRRRLRREGMDTESTAGLADHLHALSSARARQRLGRSGGPATPRLVVELLNRASGGGDRPDEALRWAELAREAVLRLALDALGGSGERLALLRDLAAEVEAVRGNVLRLLCRYDDAVAAITEARQLLDGGSGDPFSAARVWGLQASLDLDRHHLSRARHRAGRAARLSEVLEDTEGALRYRLKEAVALYESGDVEGAANLLQQTLARGLPDLEPGTKNSLAHAAACNLALYRGEAGDPQAGLDALERARRALPPVGARWRAHQRWMEGRLRTQAVVPSFPPGPLAEEHGIQLREALCTLEDAARRLRRLSASHDFALCSLDAALVELRLGMAAAVERRATTAWTVLRHLELPRPARAAFLLMLRGARQRRLDATLLLTARRAVERPARRRSR